MNEDRECYGCGIEHRTYGLLETSCEFHFGLIIETLIYICPFCHAHNELSIGGFTYWNGKA